MNSYLSRNFEIFRNNAIFFWRNNIFKIFLGRISTLITHAGPSTSWETLAMTCRINTLTVVEPISWNFFNCCNDHADFSVWWCIVSTFGVGDRVTLTKEIQILFDIWGTEAVFIAVITVNGEHASSWVVQANCDLVIISYLNDHVFSIPFQERILVIGLHFEFWKKILRRPRTRLSYPRRSGLSIGCVQSPLPQSKEILVLKIVALDLEHLEWSTAWRRVLHGRYLVRLSMVRYLNPRVVYYKNIVVRS